MPAQFRDLMSDTWSGFDALGRVLPDYAECGPPRGEKYVGIFYFLWLDKQHDPGRLYDNSQLLADNPEDPAYGPEKTYHWWGEPHLGYYMSDDEYVIRKHAQMLTDAGVDTLFFDVTNTLTYDHNFLTLCRVFTEIRSSGRTTPQIAFLANTESATTVQHLYDSFYAKNLYSDLWFYWNGKPLLLTPLEGLSNEVKEYFTLRHSWAWHDPEGWFGDGKDKWPWVDHYPQLPGWHTSPEEPEQISVCVAQHPVSNIGRSFHNDSQPDPNRITPEMGHCFTEQCQRALEVDPKLVFLTGWNEWIAMRFLNSGDISFLGRAPVKGDTVFIDQYNQEFSRDIEPMRGGHADNYYYQMAAFIRRFKGVRPRPKASEAVTILLNDDFHQWENVFPEYLDDIGDTMHRDRKGWGNAGPYRNHSGRNDFVCMKAARDETCIYFYVSTSMPITTSEGGCWMTLLLSVRPQENVNWEGYDFIINRVRRDSSTALLERNAGGWNWEPVAEVPFLTKEKQMHLRIPRSSLGLESAAKPLRFDFKWIDNVEEPVEILAFIDQGDAAPNGRFNYRYEE